MKNISIKDLPLTDVSRSIFLKLTDLTFDPIFNKKPLLHYLIILWSAPIDSNKNNYSIIIKRFRKTNTKALINLELTFFVDCIRPISGSRLTKNERNTKWYYKDYCSTKELTEDLVKFILKYFHKIEPLDVSNLIENIHI